MATRKRSSAFGISLFTFALLALVAVETLWLLAFVYSEGSLIPSAVAAAFGMHKKEDKAQTTSLKYSEHASGNAKEKAPEKESKDAVPAKHKPTETPAASAPGKATPTPVATAKKPAEGKIDTKDEQEMQSLLTREGSKGKSAATGDGL